MKFSLYSLNRAWAFDLAASLIKSNNFENLITSHPKFHTRKYGIPNRYVKSFVILLIIQKLFIKFNSLLNKLNLNWRYLKPLDWLADLLCSSYNIENEDFIIVGFGNSSRRIIKKAKAKGTKTIYYLNICSDTFRAKTLIKEYSKLKIFEIYKNIATSDVEKRWINESIEMADYIGAISSFQKKTFVEQGLSESKIFVTLPGVNTKIFTPKNVNKDKFIVLFIGNDFVSKGTHYLIDAYNSLNLKNSELWILGNNDKKFAKKIVNLKSNNIFLRTVNEFKLPEIYNQCQVFCMPTLGDSGPLVILQAMACGLPVISTKYSIAPDLITDGQEGFIVEPFDTKTISEKIKFLYDNPNVAAIMGKKARKNIEEKFTWDLLSAKLVNFYKKKS